MIDFLQGWIINIVTLVILIILLEILIPSGKTKKFVNLISGFILIIAIISPIFELLEGDIDFKEVQFTSSSFLNREEIKQKGKTLEETEMKQIIEVYRQKINSYVEETAREIKDVTNARADVIINEDYGSENFGEVKRVYLNLTLRSKSETDSAIRIDKINVGGNIKKAAAVTETQNKVKSLLEEKILETLNVPKENIIISFDED